MLCDFCLKETCPYNEDSEECEETRVLCDFCFNGHYAGENIFAADYGKLPLKPYKLKYCPCCGRELVRG